MPRSRFRRNKPNATGRNPTSRFVRLDHSMLCTNAYRALSTNARVLLQELAMLHNGQNNGSLYLSVRDAAARIGRADLSAAGNAFIELEELGFIECTADAHFHVKASEQSRARCWRLTFEPGPGRKGPTMDFLKREPGPKTKARKRMERGLRALKAYRRAREQGKLPVLDSDTEASFSRTARDLPVLETNTRIIESPGFPPNSSVQIFRTHTATTIGSGPGFRSGWWQPDWGPILSRAIYLQAFLGIARTRCAQGNAHLR